MPAHVFGLPSAKKYPLDTVKHVHAAASYGAVEHNAGRLSDADFSELSSNIEKAKKRLGLETSDSRVDLVFRTDYASGEITGHKTSIGGLVAKANLTRTGVLEYRAGDGSIRHELRHPDDVFDADSLDSLAHATVTDDHPGRVTPDNWRQESIGHIAGRPERSPDTSASGDQMVRGEIHIQHGPAIEKVKSGGLVESSCGYACKYDPTPGEYRGQRYDGRQREIRYNHVALGPPGWGRGGPEVSLRMDRADAVSGIAISHGAMFARDHQDGVSQMTDAEKQAELDKATAAAKKATQDLEQARLDAAKATTEIDKLKAQASSDQAEIAKLRAEGDILKLQANRPTEDSLKMAEMKKNEEQQIDLMISLRADARTILGDDWKHGGKDAHRIRCEVLSKIEPDFKVDGRATVALDVAAVEVAYPLAVKNEAKVRKANDDLKAALAPAQRLDEMGEAGDADVEAARKGMNERKVNAWKMTPKRKDRARMRMGDSALSPSHPKL